MAASMRWRAVTRIGAVVLAVAGVRELVELVRREPANSLIEGLQTQELSLGKSDAFEGTISCEEWSDMLGSADVHLAFKSVPQGYQSLLVCRIAIVVSGSQGEDVLVDQLVERPFLEARTYRLPIANVDGAALAAHSALRWQVRILKEDQRLRELRLTITPRNMETFLRARFVALRTLYVGLGCLAASLLLWIGTRKQAPQRGIDVQPDGCRDMVGQ